MIEKTEKILVVQYDSVIQIFAVESNFILTLYISFQMCKLWACFWVCCRWNKRSVMDNTEYSLKFWASTNRFVICQDLSFSLHVGFKEETIWCFPFFGLRWYFIKPIFSYSEPRPRLSHRRTYAAVHRNWSTVPAYARSVARWAVLRP